VKVGYDPLSKILVLTRNFVVDVLYLDYEFFAVRLRFGPPWHMFRRRFHQFHNENKVEYGSAVYDLEQVMGRKHLITVMKSLDTSLHWGFPHHYLPIANKVSGRFFHLVQDLNLKVGDVFR
jgi:hypothetical protein